MSKHTIVYFIHRDLCDLPAIRTHTDDDRVIFEQYLSIYVNKTSHHTREETIHS